MFGKARDINDTASLDLVEATAMEGIFGDEGAASNAADVSELRQRVEQVEAQISSQFTSLATYAQIAQEQVELARSEARAQTERSEQRMISLVERERADRMTALTGAPADSTPDLACRLDSLERSVAQIRQGLDDCRDHQRALATAITTMLKRFVPDSDTEVATRPAPSPAPSLAPPQGQPVDAMMTEHRAVRSSGPIAGLALN